jgi:hypothetical protein
MKPTEGELKKIKFAAELDGELDKYVYLKKDEKGFYIEYAFKDGAPHDNRCLSWYYSYQETAFIRNKWTEGLSEYAEREYLNSIKRERESKIGELFRLSSFTCGFEENPDGRLENTKKEWEERHVSPFVPEDHICKVGCPAKKCKELICKDWTYEEPVKCACWELDEPVVPNQIMIPIDLAMKLYDLNLI